MTDVLIRNVPEDQLRAIDAKAARLGLSRNDYLRREIAAHAAAEAARPETSVALEDWPDFEAVLPDAFDEELIRRAWIRD